jgi:hypothetical protein
MIRCLSHALGDLLAAPHPQVAPDDDDLLGRALPCFLVGLVFLVHEPRLAGKAMVRRQGFEPRTCSLRGCCSDR